MASSTWEGRESRHFRGWGGGACSFAHPYTEETGKAPTHQRDAQAPHVSPDVVVRLGGVWGINALWLSGGGAAMRLGGGEEVPPATTPLGHSLPYRLHSRRSESLPWSPPGGH